MHRRMWLCSMAVQAYAWPSSLLAGAQKEEALSDSVRSALSAAITEGGTPEVTFANTEQRMQFLRWLSAHSAALQSRINDYNVRTHFLRTLWYETKRAGLEPALVLGLIQIESNFRKYAVSTAGARGYMQVMPFWIRLLGNGQTQHLFHTQTNLRFGCVILRHYLQRENSDLFMALGRYNGSRGQEPYPSAVLKATQFWRNLHALI